MQLTAGTRLRSAVCATEAIIVGAPTSDLTLHCGGVPMLPHGEAAAGGGQPLAGWDGGSQLGKRYTSEDDESLEVLVTKPGAGSLGTAEQALVLKEAKPLPSSD